MMSNRVADKNVREFGSSLTNSQISLISKAVDLHINGLVDLAYELYGDTHYRVKLSKDNGGRWFLDVTTWRNPEEKNDTSS